MSPGSLLVSCRPKKRRILERAIAFCWDDEFLNVFRAYFVKNAFLFDAIAHK